jgi:phosphoribosylformimino-5-aminoimidazole carboxamide ribotide isomerase
MLIPSIDLKGGRIVQLVQGRKQALATDDVEGWIRRFERFPIIQLIDLDGALDSGANGDLVKLICERLPCRVGGGVRNVDRARALVDLGANAVIVGSSLFPNGQPVPAQAQAYADAIGIDRVIAAVDSFKGKVVTRGWTESTSVTAVEAVQALEAHCGGFLYTHVDTEGLMKGIDFEAVEAVKAVTSRPLTAAGGITTQEEIDRLDAIGVDAVVGMAIYTGRLKLD